MRGRRHKDLLATTIPLIAAVLLTMTAISSINGMNVIANDRTDFLQVG